MPLHEWARPVDWESNRDVLTELYLGQGLTLEEVMHYMQTNHNFHATMRMYKHHLRKWNLKKRLSHDQVVKIVAHRCLTNPGAVSSRMDRIDTYVRRLPPERYSQFKVAVAMAITAASTSAAPVYTEAPWPLQTCPNPTAQALSPPAKLQNPEQLLRVFRDDVSGILRPAPELSEKRSSGKPLILLNDRWFHLVDAALTMVRNGHVDYGFSVIQFCLDRGRSFLENAPPCVRMCQVLFRVNQSHPDLCQSMLKYLHQLARLLLPARDQTRLTLEKMSSLDMGDLSAVEELLLRFCGDYAENEIRADSSDSKLKSAEKLRIWGWSGADTSSPIVRKMVSMFEQEAPLWFVGVPIYPLRPELSHLYQDLEGISVEEWTELFGDEDLGMLMHTIWQSAPVIEQGHSLEDIATMQALHLCEELMFQVDISRTLEQIESSISCLDRMCPGLTSAQAKLYRDNMWKYSRQVIENRGNVAQRNGVNR
ncbi:hypothetical protein E8E14_007356 [Neopestalotiopsis sp. 37M]|nr:hypothetical protein E8E14_007356 [Neopestalotiopsis sp. 37M]